MTKPKTPNLISGFKGTDSNLQCRDFQYEVGKTYKHNGKARLCEEGFHFCTNPLDVFGYYSPSDSRFFEVDGGGDTDTEKNGGSKVACTELHINTEISLNSLLSAGAKFILDKVDWSKSKTATNTGDRSAATNTGYQSAATNTGDQSAATNTGYRSAATNTGDQSAATVEGKESIAVATGIESKAKGSLGCWLVVAEWYRDEDFHWHIKSVKSARVDGKLIKPDTFYTLENGKFVEVA